MTIEQNLSNEERTLYFYLSNGGKEENKIKEILSTNKSLLNDYIQDSKTFIKTLNDNFNKLILDENKY